MEQTLSDLAVGGGIFVLVAIIGIPLFAIIVELSSRIQAKITMPKRTSNPRQVANLEILMFLMECAAKHPDQRFGQLLINARVTDSNKDMFYEESIQILERMRKSNLL